MTVNFDGTSGLPDDLYTSFYIQKQAFTSPLSKKVTGSNWTCCTGLCATYFVATL